MVTAFWRLTISATAGAPPNSPSRVQGQLLAAGDPEAAGAEAGYQPSLVGRHGEQRLDHRLELEGILGLAHQHHLKEPVVQADGSAGMPLKPPTDTVLLTMP